MNDKFKPLRILIGIFVLLNASLLLGRGWLEKKNVDVDATIIGNLVLMIVTLLSYSLLYRAMKSTNIHAFTRMMYVNFIVKFFVILGVVVIYALLTKEINKAAVIICMIVYFVYTMIESAALTKLLKRKKDA
jgi:hypothetical protein